MMLVDVINDLILISVFISTKQRFAHFSGNEISYRHIPSFEEPHLQRESVILVVKSSLKIAYLCTGYIVGD